MKVLIAHNRYRIPGGEEACVARLQTLLRDRGHTVSLLERYSQKLQGRWGKLEAAGSMLHGGSSRGTVARAVRSSGARIAHFHNIHPLLGPQALLEAKSAGARVVMHLHNYRLFCSIGIGFRDGHDCQQCQGRSTLPGVVHNCRGSRTESVVYAAALAAHQQKVWRAVDRFIVPSQAAHSRLVANGLPAEKARVLHHFIPSNDLTPYSQADRGSYGLFVGRLSGEKGAELAVRAAVKAAVPLRIVGEGPERGSLKQLIEKLGATETVRLAGYLTGDELAAVRQKAAFAVISSRSHETGGYAALEAMAAGLPVVCTRVGALPEIVGETATVPPEDVSALVDLMQRLWQNPRQRTDWGESLLKRAREKFDEDRFFEGLKEIYAVRT